MVKLACSIGNKVCIHGDDTVITGILCFQNLNDLIFDHLRILDFIRNDQVKNQIDLNFFRQPYENRGKKVPDRRYVLLLQPENGQKGHVCHVFR